MVSGQGAAVSSDTGPEEASLKRGSAGSHLREELQGSFQAARTACGEEFGMLGGTEMAIMAKDE